MRQTRQTEPFLPGDEHADHRDRDVAWVEGFLIRRQARDPDLLGQIDGMPERVLARDALALFRALKDPNSGLVGNLLDTVEQHVTAVVTVAGLRAWNAGYAAAKAETGQPPAA